MAPTRLASKPIGNNENNYNGLLVHGITTRSKQATLKNHKDNLKIPNKRKADSPLKDATAKRAAFGDITNAFNKASSLIDKDKAVPVKKVTVESKILPTVKNIRTQNSLTNGKASKVKQVHKAAANALETIQKHLTKEMPKPLTMRAQSGILKNTVRNEPAQVNRQSHGSMKSLRSDTSEESSLYTTALENTTPSDATKEEYKTISDKLDKVNLDDTVRSLEDETESPHRVPDGVADFDAENLNDFGTVSVYAMDIFNYMKSREPQFAIDDYMQRMEELSTWMRSLLVDWMVEVQESFELNHETLYLAVKLVDLYLSRSSRKLPKNQQITKEDLQLLGASSLFIASKFDERIPPLVDDFLYICDGAYSHSQLLRMEIDVLRMVGYDLGAPLSYRFLRRYARCSRVSMPVLTLARYVLELCLVEYELAGRSDSKMAAAALYLALRMRHMGGWTPTLRYYTGYQLEDIISIALEQNAVLHRKPRAAISTVRNKYSHVVFFEVAKLPLVDDAALAPASS